MGQFFRSRIGLIPVTHFGLSIETGSSQDPRWANPVTIYGPRGDTSDWPGLRETGLRFLRPFHPPNFLAYSGIARGASISFQTDFGSLQPEAIVDSAI